MKLTIKIVSILVLIALAMPAIIIHGCGQAINGGQCGGCPDSTAPAGSKMVSPTNLGVPSAATGTCYPALSFQLIGPDGVTPLNNTCIELFTDGLSSIAKDTGLPNCGDVASYPKSSMITRTNTSGVVMIEFAVPASTAGATFFVEAVSCSLSGLATTPKSQ